jgi:hypothetical protein
MHCPHTIVACNKWLCVIRHENADYHHGTPLAERVNPLRYQVDLRWRWNNILRINRNGRMHLLLANAVYCVKMTFRGGRA